MSVYSDYNKTSSELRACECCDLHLHTYYSDGTSTPQELVDMAAEMGIASVALTDHNTVRGLPEFLAAARDKGVDAIAGIEFSVDYRDRELHLIALGIKEEHFAEIEKLMEEYLQMRHKTNRAMVQALRDDGYLIDYDEILKKSGNDYVNRAHIAAELVEKGYTTSIRQAFNNFLRVDGPYFKKRVLPDVFDMIEYIEKIGAVSILAHPFLQFDEEGLREFLREAKGHGLCGMETVYTEFSEEQTALARSLAREFELLESGGSDFHGSNKPDVAFAVGFGQLRVPASFAKKIKNIIK